MKLIVEEKKKKGLLTERENDEDRRFRYDRGERVRDRERYDDRRRDERRRRSRSRLGCLILK